MILALDTATIDASIALLREEGIIKSRSLPNQSLSSHLLFFVDALLKDAQVRKTQIRKIIVSNGPGSLTGIRVGLALAKGLSFTLGVECFAVSILDVMRKFAAKSEVFAVLSAGRNRFYWQYFEESVKTEIAIMESDVAIESFHQMPNVPIVVDKRTGASLSSITLKNEVFVCPGQLAGMIGTIAAEYSEITASLDLRPIYLV